MKPFSKINASLSKIAAIALLILISTPATLLSQMPPAQGPPPVTVPEPSLIPIFFIRNYLKLYLKDTIIPSIQAKIDAESPVDIDLSFTVTPGKPSMSETQYTDQPNQKIVTIPYKIKYKLDGILNRNLYQNIKVLVSCDGWFASGGGRLKILLRADKPYLDNPSFAEQAISFFVAGTLTNYLDNTIRSRLPDALNRAIPTGFFRTECNCLSVISDMPPNYDNSWVTYHLTPTRPDIFTSATNTISVSIKRIKRLAAKNYETNTILYDEQENITLEMFVNQKALTFTIDDIMEGQERILPDNNTLLKKPNDAGSLIVLANIMQSNFFKDSKYLLFTRAQNFGNGTKKLIVQKQFWSKPFRLPNGSMSKPQLRLVDAYEITVDIKVQNSVLQH